ncbi:MAG: hypothetical protein EBQ87_00375, partial [Planctomycetes bacterium]|nr:hypothetical protein [Planctomycetota bacterium]
ITVTTTDVTLTLTQGTSSATNIGSTTAQYAILNVSGAMTAARNLILPSSSRVYVINNNTTGGYALTIKGSATSGVTMVNGESAHIYWNGSDYAKAANTAGVATFTNLTYTGTLTGSTGVIAIGTNQIYKDSSGNVGIGTISPQNKLNVVSSDSTNAVGSSTAGITITNTYTGAYGYSSDLIYGLGGGAGTKLAGISGVYTSGGGVLAFYTYNGTTFAEKMRIDGSGNVGIGTSSLSYKFEVQGSANTYFGQRIYNTNAGSSAVTYLQLGNDTNGATAQLGLNSSANTTNFGGANGLYLSNGLSAPIAFATAGSERMRIDSSGNVGIGTSSPQQLLAIGNSTDQFGAGVSGAITTAYFGTPSNTSGGIKRIAYDRASGNLNVIGGSVASPATQMTIDNT